MQQGGRWWRRPRVLHVRPPSAGQSSLTAPSVGGRTPSQTFTNSVGRSSSAWGIPRPTGTRTRIRLASSTRTPAATAAGTSGEPAPERCSASRASTSKAQPAKARIDDRSREKHCEKHRGISAPARAFRCFRESRWIRIHGRMGRCEPARHQVEGLVGSAGRCHEGRPKSRLRVSRLYQACDVGLLAPPILPGARLLTRPRWRRARPSGRLEVARRAQVGASDRRTAPEPGDRL